MTRFASTVAAIAAALSMAAGCGTHSSQEPTPVGLSAKGDDYSIRWFDEKDPARCGEQVRAELSQLAQSFRFELGAAQLPSRMTFDVAVGNNPAFPGRVDVKVAHQPEGARTMNIVEGAELTLEVKQDLPNSGRLTFDVPADRSGTYWLIAFTGNMLQTEIRIVTDCHVPVQIALSERTVRPGQRSPSGDSWVVTQQPAFAASATLTNATEQGLSLPCDGFAWIAGDTAAQPVSPSPCSGSIELAAGASTTVEVGWPASVGANQLRLTLGDGTTVRSTQVLQTIDTENPGCPQAVQDATWRTYSESTDHEACQVVLDGFFSKAAWQTRWDDVCDGDKAPAFCRYGFDFLYGPMFFSACYNEPEFRNGFYESCQYDRAQSCEDGGGESACESYCAPTDQGGYGFDDVCYYACEDNDYAFCCDQSSYDFPHCE